MKEIFYSFLTILISLVVLDGVWIGFMLKRFYTPMMGHLMGGSVNFTAAIIFYLLYAIALSVFVVVPALKYHSGYLPLFLFGVLFGLAAYGTYNLTNQATLRNWPWMLTIVDMTWGGVLTGLTSVIAVYATRLFWHE
jgi:uncharacterized membrane protein